ncbi:MAG: exodeoxyribonuclease III [Pseudomonadota bacterium]
MRIATWNVNGLRSRLEFVLLWLRERQPDVVGLQELKLTEDQFPALSFEAEGYKALVHGQKSWNGVAILAREAIEPVVVGLPGQEEFGARLLSADVGGVRYTTVYCPNGKTVEHDDYPRKLAWYDDLARYLREYHSPERPALIGGDFNICPSGLDSWNEARFAGQIFHTQAERERFAALLATGHVDTYRALKPEGEEFSWWDYRGGAFHRRQGLRIDMLLATAPAMARVRDVVIDRDFRKKQQGLTASDHAPVWVDLD